MLMKDEDWTDLIMFEKWLSRMASVQQVFSAFKGERREDRRSTNRDKRSSKTTNFSSSSNVETKQMQTDYCPLPDGTHKIWNCALFRNMNVNDRHAAVRKATLMSRMSRQSTCNQRL